MQLNKKKELIARTLGVGKERIALNRERLDEIKDIITKQDVRDLVTDKAIVVKEKSGRRTKPKRKTRRRVGSFRKKVNIRKETYMIITRKLRAFLTTLRDKEIVTKAEYWKLRKEIRAHDFKSKAQFKDRVNQLIKERGE